MSSQHDASLRHRSPPGASSPSQQSAPMATQAAGTTSPKVAADEKAPTATKSLPQTPNTSFSPLTIAGLFLLSFIGFYATFTAPSDDVESLSKMKGVDKLVGTALLLNNAVANAIGLPTRPAKPQKGEFGKLPPMGFNSWNAFRCDISEEKFLVAADKLLELGLEKLGYDYVNIDDCWSTHERDPNTGRLVPDPIKFPDGIKGTADKIHSRGLKFGIYGTAGEETCAHYPASLGHETLDAQTWADWGVDFLKYDNCGVPDSWKDPYSYYPEDWYGTYENQTGGPAAPLDYDWSKSLQAERFYRMRDAIKKTGREMYYSLCNWGHGHSERWARQAGAASWRMWGDIVPQWEGKKEWSWGFMPIVNYASFFAEYTDFYGHNDFDMLEVGNGNLTDAETRTHFALWAGLKSPLLIGTPLDQIEAKDLAVLKNKEIVAFNQDPVYGASILPFKWGINPAWTWNQTHPAEFYSGQSVKGINVFVMNTLDVSTTKSFTFEEVPGLRKYGEYEVKDLWTGKKLGVYHGAWRGEVEAHDTRVLLFTEKGGKHPHKGKLPKPAIWKKKPISTVWPLPKGGKE
ncbi:glycoside hydrolase [Ascobolus immersus RN42]|uniref:Alpha-galactosidase n=1 Tax=Ascobolus immersus RN42 TaxID=1160509 RepID=A0A3N4IF62_ASCIM|nr:glycoside hydrolase [Ascobolus immersus RN42]